MVYGAHADGFKHRGESSFHRTTIFQNVADAAWATAIIFEHHVLPLVIADQVRAADVNVNILRHLEVHELAAKMFSRKDVVRGNNTLLDDSLLVINVVEEKIERRDALRQTAFEKFPFLRRNDSRDEIERKNPLRA